MLKGGYIENKNGDNGIIFKVKTAGEAMRIDGGTGRVGIGTSSPARPLSLTDTTNDGTGGMIIASYLPTFELDDISGGGTSFILQHDGTSTIFKHDTTERMRIDASGNVLVGTTTTTNLIGGTGNDGVALTPNHIEVGRSGGAGLFINRYTSDGDIAVFRKDGTTIGSIGTVSSTTYIAGDASGIRFGSTAFMPTTTAGANKDNLLIWGILLFASKTSTYQAVYTSVALGRLISWKTMRKALGVQGIGLHKLTSMSK